MLALIEAAGQPTFSNRFCQELIGGSPQIWKNFPQTGGVLREEMRLVKADGVTWVKIHSAPILDKQTDAKPR